MVKKKGAIAAKARAKREARQGQSEPLSCAVREGPLVHKDGLRVHRGLMNLGNTCFMNSVAQCLNVSLPFSDELIRLAADGLDGMSGSLCTVMRGIRATDDTCASLQKFKPQSFHTELVNRFPWYFGKQQHDAHEFLRTLLGSISDERTLEERSAIEEAMATSAEGIGCDLDSPSACSRCIRDNFRGQLLAASLCWSCGHVTGRLDPFLDLSLDLPMPSGTRRNPLGISAAVQCGADDTLAEEELPLDFEEKCEGAEADNSSGPLLGRWAANRDAEALAAIREVTPVLVARIVIEVLRKELLSAEKDGASGPSVQISLSRKSKKASPRWGFRWSEANLKQHVFVIWGVAEDSIVDRWNLKRMSAGDAQLAIYPGDILVEVNGSRDYEAMRQELKKACSIELSFVRSGVAEPAGSRVHDETDDEAEELRAAQAAAHEARRQAFDQQAAECYEALPSALQGVFGAAQINRTRSGHLDLEHCLEQFSMPEALEDEYQPVYSCAMCKSRTGCKTYASRRFWLWPVGLPPILTVQLKRFRRYATDYVKSMTSVALPAVLDLSQHVLTSSQFEILSAHAGEGAEWQNLAEDLRMQAGNSWCYELYGICEHQGSQMQDGHYVAYVNAGPSLAEEEWLGISDAKLWKCERAEVLKVEAYIAFYRCVHNQHVDPDIQEATTIEAQS